MPHPVSRTGYHKVLAPAAKPPAQKITRKPPADDPVQVLKDLEDLIHPPESALNPRETLNATIAQKTKLIEATSLLVTLIFGYLYCYGNKDLPFPNDKLRQVVALLLQQNYSIMDVRRALTQNVEETKGFINAIAFYISYWVIKFFSTQITSTVINGFYTYFRKEINSENKEDNLQNYTSLLFETINSFLADYNTAVENYSDRSKSPVPAKKSKFMKRVLKESICHAVHLPQDKALKEVFKRFAIVCTNKFVPTPNLGRKILHHFISLEWITCHPLLKIIPRLILSVASIPFWFIIFPLDKLWLNKSIKTFIKNQIQTLTPTFLDAKVPDLIDGRPFANAINKLVRSLLQDALVSPKTDNEPSAVSDKLRKDLSATAKELLRALDTAGLQTHHENVHFAEQTPGYIKKSIEESLVEVVEDLFGLTCTYLSKPENANEIMLKLFESLVSAFDQNYAKGTKKEKAFNAQYEENKKAVRDLLRQIVDQEVQNAVDAYFSGISLHENNNIDKHLLKLQELAQKQEKGIRNALKKDSEDDVLTKFHAFHQSLYKYRTEDGNTKKAISKALKPIYLLNRQFTEALKKKRTNRELNRILDKIFKQVRILHSANKHSKLFTWENALKIAPPIAAALNFSSALSTALPISKYLPTGLLGNVLEHTIVPGAIGLATLGAEQYVLKMGKKAIHKYVAREVQGYINTAWDHFIFDPNVGNGLLHHAIVNVLESEGEADCSKPISINI